MSSVVISGNTSGTITLDAPAVAGTTVLTLPATSGTVVTKDTNGIISVNGVQFPATQSASADANCLDDYEEGTWTPTDTSGAGLTFSAASGFYTKIGNLVTAIGRVVYPATANASATSVGGLPFAVPNNTVYRSGANGYNNNGLSLYPIATINTSNCTFILHSTGGSITNAQATGMTVNFTITYQV